VKLAVLPARGGSKRIPRKNIKPFCGKPIIVWSIEAAMRSGCFERIVVSTDDEEIAAVARDAGAEVPFMRPAALADDHTATIPVVRHAIEWQNANGAVASHVCCIYATAPFVTGDDLRRGLDLLRRDGADFALAVARYTFPIQRAVRIDAAGRLSMFSPEHFNTRSQDLEEAYHDAGQFYWGLASAWLTATSLFSAACAGVIQPPHRVQDIDTAQDWIRAEALFRATQGLP
jgi:pseudaminic acid cytidylyltransferase